jgi:hypothetical protein
VIRFEAHQRPAERVRRLTEGARASAALPSVRQIASDLCGGSPSGTDLYLLTSAVQRPRWYGNTESDVSRGQWVDTNVAAIVRGGGDCLARSYALVALLTARGYSARVMWCRVMAGEPLGLDHAIVAIDGRGFVDPSGSAPYSPELPPHLLPLTP